MRTNVLDREESETAAAAPAPAVVEPPLPDGDGGLAALWPALSIGLCLILLILWELLSSSP